MEWLNKHIKRINKLKQEIDSLDVACKNLADYSVTTRFNKYQITQVHFAGQIVLNFNGVDFVSKKIFSLLRDAINDLKNAKIDKLKSIVDEGRGTQTNEVK